MRKNAIIIFSIAVLLICLSAAVPAEFGDYSKATPPGTVKIAANLYYDQTEIANVHWREYVAWMRRVFGENSEEYKRTLPDTLVWMRKDTCLRSYSGYYNAPAANFYPMVGITQKQAEDFCKWRSDRVFEAILKNRNIIKEDLTQNKDHYFTIEKFYASQYQGVKPDSNQRYYPHYRLPTIAEWRLALRFENSVERKHKLKRQHPNMSVMPCTDTKWPYITKPFLNVEELSLSQYALVDLHGNVSEWVSERDMSVGGAWMYNEEILQWKDAFQATGVNAWTGFRCAFEWREWK